MYLDCIDCIRGERIILGFPVSRDIHRVNVVRTLPKGKVNTYIKVQLGWAHLRLQEETKTLDTSLLGLFR